MVASRASLKILGSSLENCSWRFALYLYSPEFDARPKNKFDLTGKNNAPSPMAHSQPIV